MAIEKRRKPRVERVLRKRAPLAVENTKKMLILKGHHTSQTINDVLRDLVRTFSLPLSLSPLPRASSPNHTINR
jgi:hypothetical protein